MPRLPFEVAVATPCQEQWSRMSGSARQRYCAACEREVHDFAAMTPREIERIVVSSGGHLCARITRREDGSLLTLPEPQRRRAAGFVFAAPLLAGPVFAQSPDQNKSTVTGVVTDATGAAIKGAKVELLKSGTPVVSAAADSDGKYHLDAEKGSYILRVSSLAFISQDVPLKIEAPQQAIPRVVLQVGVLMGDVVVIDPRPRYQKLGSHLRHPISYLRSLRYRYFS